ncbi:MAG TPA: hypothetical protein VKF32_08915 [Thermoanaerobaculia bacterium]|nr:hypothetical protein [Thermoanaerobaculia bacterium]
MKVPIIGTIDERFLAHRLRSTSVGGMAGVTLALVLFLYRLHVDHRPSWDLFAVGVTAVAVKLAVLAWYRITD